MSSASCCRCHRLVIAVAFGLALSQAEAQRAPAEAPVPEAVVAAPAPTTLAEHAVLMPVVFQEQDAATTQETTEVTTKEETRESPFSLDITYCICSDYVFRGVNFSEYPGEGREKPNHQLDVSLSVDLGPLWGQEPGTCGTFGFGTWFEWFAAQKKLDPIKGGQNLQEIDYTLSWSYDIDPIATTFALGYAFFTIANHKDANTHEWWFSLEHNDAWMWKWLWPDNEGGVLNPSFLLAHDVDALNGVWMEIGLKHDFALFENFTLTPNVTAAIDHRYLDDLAGTGRNGTTRFAYVQYGLNADYDLAPVLKLPEWLGMNVAGFLNFNDAVGTAEDDGTIQDEFYGGMSVGLSF